MSLFPLITPPEGGAAASGGLPLYREIAWNYEENRPVWRDGRPVVATGAEAVKAWAWNALHTERGAHAVFTRGLGQALRELTGKPYLEAIRREEALRYIRETLKVNPYITEVAQAEIQLVGAELHLTVRIQTIYGEVTLHADDL